VKLDSLFIKGKERGNPAAYSTKEYEIIGREPE
jgi:hypothetical protein